MPLGCYNGSMDIDQVNLTPGAIAQRGLIRRIAAAFRPYKSQVIVVGLLILVSAGLGVVNPLLIRVVFDSALFPVVIDAAGLAVAEPPNLNLLWILAGVMVAVTVLTTPTPTQVGISPKMSPGGTMRIIS